MTDVRIAAQRWAETWKRSWEAGDGEALIALYATGVRYWSEPFREPYDRDRLRRYFTEVTAEEDSVEAWFGEPVVTGDRAAVAWWATLLEDGKPISLAGISLLRFDADGLVVEQWDGWNEADESRPRPAGWAS